MHADAIEVIGLVAGFISAFSYAPQAYKIVRDGDASGVSALTYAMVLCAALMWFSYGVFRAAPSIMLWNAVAAAMAGLVLTLKLRQPKKA
ncbi:MAG: SemiSWEET family transporter [Terricaulis sp.]